MEKRPQTFGWRVARWASAGMCLVLIGLWAHSMFYTGYLVRYWDFGRTFPSPTIPGHTCVEEASGRHSLFSYRGSILLGRDTQDSVVDPEVNLNDEVLDPHPYRVLWYRGWDHSRLDPATFRGALLGFKYINSPQDAYLIVPYWAPVLLAGLLMLFTWRHKKRVAKGLCQKCGYNLIGTPAAADGSRRCSECGEADAAS